MEDFKTMTKTHMVLFTSLALVLALSLCVSQAKAEDTLRFHTSNIRVPAPEAIPAAGTPLIQQGMTAMGPNPPTYGPPPSWPCFPTAAPCSADPAGGMLA